MIKRLSTSDIEYIKKMVLEFNDTDIRIEKTIEYLEDQSNYLIGFIKDDKIVGYVSAYSMQRYDGKDNMMYIHEINVHEDYRLQGIGRALLNKVKEICEENSFMKMFLITNKSNTRAVSLYKSTNGKSYHDDDVIYTFKSDSF